MSAVEDAVSRVYREQWPALVAGLARWTGDLDRAEDAADAAVAAAARAWPRDGVPDRPAAWLHTTARHRVLDRLRQDRTGPEKLAMLAADPGDEPAVYWSDAAAEDLLRLVFTCCHPALAPSAQVALALRLLCGLSSAEAARLLLTTEATVAQRLVRAKRKIRDAGIVLQIPSRAAWPDRLGAVLTLVGLLFTEGFTAAEGPALARAGLCNEALRLAGLLHLLLPDEPEVLGLSAVLLITDARRGERSQWRWADIGRGLDLAAAALRRGGERPGPWTVQAAIAALNVHPEPDHAAAVALYDRLVALLPAPPVLADRAAAIAQVPDPSAGLATLDEIPGGPADHRMLVLRAELHAELGQAAEARDLMRAAVAATHNDVDRRHLQARVDAWSS